ncbi:hypothetical protein SDC9_100168 [bioreactor metagenome]|uniref:Uncharacterized protein n=1 Tax=bioreactor metagenome TaxID=1076179 RepID=A0A645AJV1_9ZZZZ
MTYECQIIFQSEVTQEKLNPLIYEKRYATDQDFHTIYFGEIVATYLTAKGE